VGQVIDLNAFQQTCHRVTPINYRQPAAGAHSGFERRTPLAGQRRLPGSYCCIGREQMQTFSSLKARCPAFFQSF
jgi:hypothetical protein